MLNSAEAVTFPVAVGAAHDHQMVDGRVDARVDREGRGDVAQRADRDQRDR
jgi:hypothetical protein